MNFPKILDSMRLYIYKFEVTNFYEISEALTFRGNPRVISVLRIEPEKAKENERGSRARWIVVYESQVEEREVNLILLADEVCKEVEYPNEVAGFFGSLENQYCEQAPISEDETKSELRAMIRRLHGQISSAMMTIIGLKAVIQLTIE